MVIAMYDDLIKQLRYCADAITCRNCIWKNKNDPDSPWKNKPLPAEFKLAFVMCIISLVISLNGLKTSFGNVI